MELTAKKNSGGLWLRPMCPWVAVFEVPDDTERAGIGRPNMATEEIKSLRARLWSLRVHHAVAKRQARVKQAELIADAFEVEAAKLAKLLSRSAKRK